jgi:hypothetical protein
LFIRALRSRLLSYRGILSLYEIDFSTDVDGNPPVTVLSRIEIEPIWPQARESPAAPEDGGT